MAILMGYFTELPSKSKRRKWSRLKLRLAKQGFEQHETLRPFNPILFLAC